MDTRLDPLLPDVGNHQPHLLQAHRLSIVPRWHPARVGWYAGSQVQTLCLSCIRDDSVLDAYYPRFMQANASNGGVNSPDSEGLPCCFHA
jgi:hypothetical protein